MLCITLRLGLSATLPLARLATRTAFFKGTVKDNDLCPITNLPGRTKKAVLPRCLDPPIVITQEEPKLSRLPPRSHDADVAWMW
jgi:hypothetical protein